MDFLKKLLGHLIRGILVLLPIAIFTYFMLYRAFGSLAINLRSGETYQYSTTEKILYIGDISSISDNGSIVLLIILVGILLFLLYYVFLYILLDCGITGDFDMLERNYFCITLTISVLSIVGTCVGAVYLKNNYYDMEVVEENKLLSSYGDKYNGDELFIKADTFTSNNYVTSNNRIYSSLNYPEIYVTKYNAYVIKGLVQDGTQYYIKYARMSEEESQLLISKYTKMEISMDTDASTDESTNESNSSGTSNTDVVVTVNVDVATKEGLQKALDDEEEEKVQEIETPEENK